MDEIIGVLFCEKEKQHRDTFYHDQLTLPDLYPANINKRWKRYVRKKLSNTTVLSLCND